MAISEEEIRQIARLVRLEVDDSELPGLARHFNGILGHFERLQEVDVEQVDDSFVEGVEITPWRKDEVVRWENREKALGQAPDREGDFFRVPRIVEED
jgi:aspartyl-tRNA(Asn)/glutamyl-tRNA(Gln) amidotransferase subunit C